jgi:hypothetical protein
MREASSAAGGTPGASAAPTFRGETADDDGPYRLIDGPRHVTHEDRTELPGHHEATFETAAGQRLDRYVTDKGRAELLRLVDAGQETFTGEEMRWLTTEASLEALLASMAGEGAEGA